MNRIIKFRGKSTSTGEWIYGDLWQNLTIPDKPVCIISYWKEENGIPTNYETRVIPETVGQYTGLSDKRDNDVYEGDIFNIYSFGVIYRVAYLVFDIENALWKFIPCNSNEMIDINWLGHTLKMEYRSIEKIGNIHDNPDLLTTIKQDNDSNNK